MCVILMSVVYVLFLTNSLIPPTNSHVLSSCQVETKTLLQPSFVLVIIEARVHHSKIAPDSKKCPLLLAARLEINTS